MVSTVYLNGELLARTEARISVDDRGFLFGDGIYEVARVIEGRLFEWPRHERRLRAGMAALQLSVPEWRDGLMEEIAAGLLQANGLRDGEATIYLQVTRGAAPRAHQFPPPGTRATIFASCQRFVPPAELRQRGAAALTVPDIRWMRCDLKTINLLPNVLAKQKAVAAGALESLFVRDGVLIEGSHSNVFGVMAGELRTHPATNHILAGVTREVVLELAVELGIPTREAPVYMSELPAVEELFVTGTTTDVTPIVQLDGRPAGGGRPGPISRALQRALAERMAAAPAVRA